MKAWLIGLAISGGIGWAFLRAPGWILGWLKENIHRAFDAGDDVDDKLLRSICEWADEKIIRRFPDGQGDAPYLAAADWCIGKLPAIALPFVKRDKLAKCIHDTIDGLKALLKESAK